MIDKDELQMALCYSDIRNEQNAFLDGIDWFLDNLWHDISECNNKDFKEVKEVLGLDRDGFLDVRTGAELWADQTDYVKWLYIDDLLKGGK